MAKNYDRYEAGSINVDTDGTIIDPDFVVEEIQVVNRSTQNDIEFRTLGTAAQSIDGPWIPILQGSGSRTPFERKFNLKCDRIEIRAQANTADVDYFLRP